MRSCWPARISTVRYRRAVWMNRRIDQPVWASMWPRDSERGEHDGQVCVDGFPFVVVDRLCRCSDYADLSVESLVGEVHWADIEARTLNRYVAERGHGYALASKRHLVTAMKSLLAWAFTTAGSSAT